MTYTDDDRRRDDMIRKKADPEFERKRVEGIRRYWAEKGTAGSETRERLSRCAAASWAKRRLKGTDKFVLSDEERNRRREQLQKNKQNPNYETRRLKAIKAFSSSPKGKVKRSVTAQAVNDKRRGFKVPAKLWNEYRWLVDAKKIPAREAGKMLGLINDGAPQ